MHVLLRRGWCHGALLVVGAVALFALALRFGDVIWFDESYSIALADESVGDIWDIGASDVHPVLYYVLLHCVRFLFGDAVIVYRAFSIVGIVALSLLGFTCVRTDFGWRAGLLFSLFSLFTPYLMYLALQIRMYSWTMFSIAFCFICSYRIIFSIGRGERVPPHRWALLFLSSLASAYLHYFGAVTAFLINATVLAAIVRFAGVRRRRYAIVLMVGAVVQVACYAPWLAKLASQVADISGGAYWITFDFPDTLIEIIAYPLLTDQVDHVLASDAPVLVRAALAGIMICFVSLSVFAFARALFGREAATAGRGKLEDGSPDRTSRACSPGSGTPISGAEARFLVAFGCGLYAGVIAVAWLASVAMGTLIVYYRYLAVPLAPLLIALAVAFSRVRSRSVSALALASFALTAIVGYVALAVECGPDRNDGALDALEQAATTGSFAASEGSVGEDGEQYLPVVSSSIGISGVAAVMLPDVSQSYIGEYGGYWGPEYACYGPSLVYVDDADSVLGGYEGRFVVLDQSDGNGSGIVDAVADEYGAVVVERRSYYRPYDEEWFSVTIMETVGDARGSEGAAGTSSEDGGIVAEALEEVR